MKKIHIICLADSNLCDLAILLKNKGCDVTISYCNLSTDDLTKLISNGLINNPEGWHPNLLSTECEYIIASSDIAFDNPEVVKAKELNINILSFAEYIFKKIKDKLRVIVKEPTSESSIIDIIFYVLKKNNMLFDYVVNNNHEIFNKEQSYSVNWSYDTRMAVLENNPKYSNIIKKPLNEYYRPHILVLSEIKDGESDSFKKLLSSIEKNGKLIYNENDKILSEFAESVREDITAIPFNQHSYIEEGNEISLKTRFGDFPIKNTSEEFLINLNAARITCRHMGIKDQDFYQAISEYSGKQ